MGLFSRHDQPSREDFRPSIHLSPPETSRSSICLARHGRTVSPQLAVILDEAKARTGLSSGPVSNSKWNDEIRRAAHNQVFAGSREVLKTFVRQRT